MSKLQARLSQIVCGLYLLLVFSLGSMKPSFDIGFAALTPTDLIFPVVVLCWLAAIAVGSYRLQWRSELLFFAFYFLALAVSAIFSTDALLSFARLPGSAYLILLAIIGAHVLTTFDRLRVSILVWIAGSIIPLTAALIGIFLFYFVPDNSFLPELTYHYGAVPVGNYPRISSTFISASMLCNYLTVTFVLTVVSARMRWIKKGIAWTIVLTVIVCALFTVSIALGGIVLAAGLCVWITSTRTTAARASLILALAIAVAFLAIAPIALLSWAGSSFVGGLVPSSRILVWSQALGTFLSHPLTGAGIGTAVANVTFHNYDGTWSLLTDAHNSFLSVAAQSGILGLGGILAIVVATLRAGIADRSDREDESYIRKYLAVGFFSAFVYEGLTGSFEEARHLWVLIGFILAANKIARTPDESVPLHGA